jgi:cellulose synthase/poly-beta-1,6-N-acetylglucosamine synthase-like glycosyltransferase
MPIAVVFVLLPVAILGYAYVVYPVILWCIARVAKRPATALRFVEWPMITITLPVHNEEHIFRSTLEHVLSLDYPPERRHVLVISDASTDGTDAIAAEFRDRGVELIRLPVRAGKTAAENAADAHLRGEIIVNIDATARPARDALKELVAAFADPTVGLASGRDVSTGSRVEQTSAGESRYVGYEMWVRGLETKLGSIVGASGCFYAIRRGLYDGHFPASLSRDFASALVAREHGLRAVSVDSALCAVPRAGSLHAEYRRKVRTMHRGLETLWYKRTLLDPFEHGHFAFALISHKLCRWLLPLALPFGAVGLVMLAMDSALAAWFVAGAGMLLALSAIALRRKATPLLRQLAMPSYLVMANVAGIVAWWELIAHKREAIWEPTRRPASESLTVS